MRHRASLLSIAVRITPDVALVFAGVIWSARKKN